MRPPGRAADVQPTTRYRGVALLALVGLFISVYLLLYSMGWYGDLLCGTGSCEVVQASDHAVFVGVPVPAWGAAWYAAVLVAGLMLAGGGGGIPVERFLVLLAAGGLAFSAYLTWIEAFVLEAWCRWCVASAVLTVLIFLLVVPWRRPGRDEQAVTA